MLPASGVPYNPEIVVAYFIFVLNGVVYLINWVMFRGGMYLKLVLLLMLVNCVSGFNLELMDNLSS